MNAARLPDVGVSSRVHGARRGARAALGLAYALSLACGRDRGTDPVPVAPLSVAVSLPTAVLRVGDTLRANAEAADSAGHLLTGRAPRWETSDSRVASISPSGLVLGVAPGRVTISAVVDGSRGAAQVEVVRPLVASIAITPDSVAIAATVVVKLGAVARDASGAVISAAEPVWSSSAPDVATVDAAGRVTAVAVGRAEIRAAVDGAAARAVVVVTRPSSVAVTSVAPAQLVPGATLTITGSGFSTNRTANTVTIGGVAAVVRSATATQIAATVATTGYGCTPTRDVPVSVTVNGESGAQPATLQVAPQYALAVGQSLVLSDPAQARCLELTPASGRYVVAVYDVSPSSAAVPFTLRGGRSDAPTFTTARVALAAAPAPAIAPSTAATAATARTLHASGAVPLLVGRAVDAKAALGPAAVPARAVRAPAAAGDTTTIKVLGSTARSCNDATTDVRARTVYVGRHVTALEDVGAPLAGTMDDDLRRIAQEFDDVTYPMLEATFGNPLAVDARLGRTGRIALFFTRAVNDRPGTLGLTLSCDLVPASSARASNEMQIVYLAVPTSAAAGLGDGRATGTRDAWRRRIRSIAAHEAKHLTSYAERLSREAPFEEPWLEEGSALVAEELFARLVRGLPMRANTTYRESVACELRPGDPGCADAPIAFSDHFARLYLTLSDPANLTPLVTDPTVDPASAFYGASWWLLRWAADQSPSTDAAFFRALVAGPQTGIDNLAARTGRPWSDLLGDWWLASATDDLAGFTPQRAQLTAPSWNLRDVFAGAQTSGDPRFARAFPLAPRPVSFGDFAVDVTGGVRGGGAAFFELSGLPAARQLLEVRPPAGATLPNVLGVAIVRVP